MAVGTTNSQANDFQTFQAKGIREQLSDIISRIDPEDTPLQANTGEDSVGGTLYEWQTDVLRAAGANANVQGFVAAPRAVTPTVRVGNYTQLSADSFGISGTEEAVDKAGRRSEEAYQLTKVGAEVKRDIEWTLLSSNQGGYAGGVDDPTLTASLGAWIKTNVSKDAGGTNPTYTAGVPNAGRSDGSLREATIDQINAVMQSCKRNGAKPSILLVNETMKQKVSTFATSAVAQIQYTQTAKVPVPIIGAADVIITDFGVLTIVTDLFQRERDMWFIDPSMIRLRVLRPYMTKPLATRGDSTEVMVLKEWGLQVKNEKGLGLIADVKTTP